MEWKQSFVLFCIPHFLAFYLVKSILVKFKELSFARDEREEAIGCYSYERMIYMLTFCSMMFLLEIAVTMIDLR